MKISYKRNLKPILLIVFACFVFSSCQKETSNNSTTPDENYINEVKATTIARGFSKDMMLYSATNTNKVNGNSANLPSEKAIKSTKPIPSKDGRNAFYIINYTGGGFAILSADRRTVPVLAFSETNTFKTDIVPAGVDEWLYNTRVGIEELRAANIPYKQQDKVQILKKSSRDERTIVQQNENPGPGDEPPMPECEDMFGQVGPLLSTQWGQGSGYNNVCPQLGCSAPSNGRAYTGCVAVAMAQVMKYYQFPTNLYNWNNMPDDSPSPTTAFLMRSAGNSVDMEYGCDSDGGSGAYTSKIPNAFKYAYGYTGNMQYVNYEDGIGFDLVKHELNLSRPVIFRGGRNGGGLFPYKDGHTWVCDGYIQSYTCPVNGYGESGYTYLHMNWGWGGNYDDWYGCFNFTNGNGTYNYKNKIVIGIHP
ncbi:MAG: C10 family peptidase [Daejeonella sp.]